MLTNRNKSAESRIGGGADQISIQQDGSSTSPSERFHRPISVMVDVENHDEPSICSVLSNGPNNNGPPYPLEQVVLHLSW